MATDPRDRARAMWRYIGEERPPFAISPGPGQESVWDYPRPPRVEASPHEVIVRAGELVVARTQNALRVLETASPPTFYLPWSDLDHSLLSPASGSSFCEWKGAARYWTVRTATSELAAVGWSYPDPSPAYEVLRDHVGFYPSVLECYVGGAHVQPQPGRFYAGWITPDVVGPFKGEPGSQGW